MLGVREVKGVKTIPCYKELEGGKDICIQVYKNDVFTLC